MSPSVTVPSANRPVTATGQAPPAAAADQDDPVVCKQAKIPDVGTRFKPKPICRKKSQWALELRLEKQGAQDFRDKFTPYPSEKGR